MDKKNKNQVTIRNATHDFLVFSQENNGDGVDVLVANDNVWLTQKMMARLFDCGVDNVNVHLKNIFADGEQNENSVIEEFSITATDGKKYKTKHYSLEAVISVGYRINSKTATAFRRWATKVLKEFAQKGYVLDKERLKNDRIFSKTYFENLLEDIREIRLSERKFYQKITDIYALAFDYDPTSEATQEFFKTVQNKLHFAIHQHTAAEIIVNRANAKKDKMGLTTWENAPHGKIRKSDVVIAKNYLNETEMKALERIVMAYLEFAEFQAENQVPMSQVDWRKRLDLFLAAAGTPLLNNAGKVSALEAKIHAENEFEKYRVIQDREYRSGFDKFLDEVNGGEND